MKRNPAPTTPQYSAFLKLDTGTHTDDIIQIAVTPDGRQIVTAGECTIRVWDTQTRQLQRLLLSEVPPRSEEVYGSGNVVAFAISPDSRWIVALKAGDSEHADEVQVFELATGRLCTRYDFFGILSDLAFSPDGRWLAVAGSQRQRGSTQATVQLHAARDVLKAGFDKPPRVVASQVFQRFRAKQPVSSSVRFVPGAGLRLVVATSSETQGKTPGRGMLHWALFSPSQGLQGLSLQASVDTPGPVLTTTLAVSHDGVVVAAATPLRRGKRRLGQLLQYGHDAQPCGVTVTESPPASALFSASGCHLLVGLSADTSLTTLTTPGDSTVQVNAYAVDCNGLNLRSTYYGHDDSVTALAFLGDTTVLSAGGDHHAIHQWDRRSRVGVLLQALRGTGRTMFSSGVNAAEQVMFSTVPARLLPPYGGGREQRFCLRSMRLSTNQPSAMRNTDYESRKWVILDITRRAQIIPLRYSPAAYGDALDLPPDLSLFIGADDEWVLYSRSGYYDASPKGARHIGYHVNRGPNQAALFVRSDRFKDFYNKDIIQAIVRWGSEDRARAKGVKIEPLDVAQMLPPLIELAAGGVAATRDSVTFSFSTFTANPQVPITRVWILRNDSYAWSELHPAPGPETHYRVKLLLRPGRNTFSLRAETARARAEAVDWEITGPPMPDLAAPSLTARGHLYLLSVGVSDFAVAGTDAALGTQRLRCPHHDAMALYNALAKSSASTQALPRKPLRNRAFDQVHATLLVNQQATKAAILDALNALCAQIQQRHQTEGEERDVLLVFLSGHGLRYQGEPDLYFFNYDLLPEKADMTGVSMQELGEIVSAVPAEVVLVVDACHAGMAGNNVVRGLDPEELAQRIHMVSERGMYVLAAARAEEKAREDRSAGLSVFTEALLEALRSSRHLLPDAAPARTRSITMMSLMAGLQEMVPRVSQRAGTVAQTPVCHMYGGLLPLTIYRE